jgi:hypothetical protein
MPLNMLERERLAGILIHRKIAWGKKHAIQGYSIIRIISARCARDVIWFSLHICAVAGTMGPLVRCRAFRLERVPHLFAGVAGAAGSGE